MHVHTRRSPDSRLSFTDAVEGAKKAGLDAICITEHDRFTSEKEVAEMMERYGFIIFGGAEFNTKLGHFLVYDVPSEVGWTLERDLLLDRLQAFEREIRESPMLPLHRLQSRLSRLLDLEISDLIRQVHLAKGLVFWAHPMDDYSALRAWFNKFTEDEGTTDMSEFARWLRGNDELNWMTNTIAKLDGFEILNGSRNERGVCNLLARQVAEAFEKPGIAGSDAHHRYAVGRVATRFDVDTSSSLKIADLVQTMRTSVEVCKPFSVNER